MDAGVDHQPRGAEDLHLQVAVAAGRVPVQAELEAQCFGIQRPAFDIGGESHLAPERGQVGELRSARHLQVVPRHRLVRDQCLHAPDRPGAKGRQVGVEPAGAAAVQGRAVVVLGLVGIQIVGHGAHPVGRARQFGKQLRQLGIDALGDVAVTDQQCFAAGMEVLRIGIQLRHPLHQAALEAGRAGRGLDLALQPRHLAQPGVV